MPTYRVQNLATQHTRDFANLRTAFRPAAILPVPYVSQLVQGALRFQNDCGPACVAMLLRAYYPQSAKSVDELFASVSAADEYLSFGNLITLLRGEQIDVVRIAGLKMPQVFDLLRRGRPIIALINYGVLNKAGLTEKKGFNGPHFAVVVGMDSGTFYVHDPYYSAESGQSVPYPYPIFYEAWRRASEQFNNPAFAGLIPVRSLFAAENAKFPPLYRIRLVKSEKLYAGAGVNHAVVDTLLGGIELEVGAESADKTWGLVRPWLGHWINLTSKSVKKI